MRTANAIAAELRQSEMTLTSLHGRGRVIEAKAKTEGRDLSADEARSLDKILAQFDQTTAKIDQLKAELGEAERREDPMSQPLPRAAAPSPIHYTPPQAPAEVRAARAAASMGNGGAVSPIFASMFPAAAGDTRGFASLGDFAAAVARRDTRLLNAAGASEGVGSDGGFYVPGAFIAGVLDASLQAEAIRPRALLFPVNSSPVTIPLFDTSDRSSSIAGMNPELRGEGVAGTNQKPKLATLTMDLSKQMIIVPATAELLEDSPAVFNQLLSRYMIEALSAKLDDVFINGLGAGEPLGIVGAGCTVSVAKEGSQVAATIVPENVAKMVSRLAPGSFSKAVWLVHSSALAQLYQLTKVVKNVAATENVGGNLVPWFTVDANGQMSLLGRPVVVTDRAQQLGTVGDIILADLSQYAIAFRSEAKLAVDTSYGFTSDEIYFRLTYRCDGQPLLKSAITPRNGSDTLSPFVTLATRS